MSWFTALSLRARTLIVGSVLSVALIAVGASVPIPYVVEGPGQTDNTLGVSDGQPVISVTGTDAPASATEKISANSHLNMTTISVRDGVSLFSALGFWISGDNALVPRDEVYPPNESIEQVNQENAELFTDSQSAAEVVAERYVKLYPNVVYVGDIPAGSASSGKLQPQDQITSIIAAGRTIKVTDYNSLKAALSITLPKQTITVVVLRNGKAASVKVTLGADSTGKSKQGFLGIGAVERPLVPFTVKIQLTGIGGPSAGLMFTLGLIDKLTPGDLASGHFVAGTGTMEDDDDLGTVGPIGGILMKMIGARDAGATIFLVPADNCTEALTRVPAGLELVKVSTVDNAMSALKTIAAGGTPPGC